jgi:hypothetical protein
VAVDESVLDEAGHSGLAGIVIERARTGQLLWAPLPRWRHGIRVFRGFGSQRALRWSDLEPLPGEGGQVTLFAALGVAP